MKCSICGKELSSLGHCPGCGQLIPEREPCESVKNHWQAVQTETKRYESKLDQAADEVRTQFRKTRNGRRLRLALLAVVIAAAVFFLGGEMVDSGVQYLNAWWTMERGEYALAAEMFEALDSDFLNAREYAEACRDSARPEYYQEGLEAFASGEYRQALALFEQSGSYSDASDYADRCASEILSGLTAPAYHWSFDEDLSEANGTHSEQRGDAVAKNVVDSRIGGAAILDGDGDYVTGGTGANITENWTLSTLLLPRSWEDMAVLAKMDWATGSFAYRMYIQGGFLVWAVTMENGEILELVSQSAFIPGEKWYLVSVVKEGDQLRLYVDGREEASLTLSGAPAGGEEILTIGDQTFREENCTLTGFRGCVADLAIYETALDALELELMYRVREYDCTHAWDTSFYALPEDALRDHFVIYRSVGEDERTEILVFDLQDDMEDVIHWYSEEMSFCYGDDSRICNVARYYQEGEEWIYLDSGMEESWTTASDVISSSLSVYRDGEPALEPLLIGGMD